MEQNTTSQQPQTQPTQTPTGQLKTPTRRYARPAASITETADGFVVQVEMPGVNRQGLEITFENGELTLVGHRAPASAGQEGTPTPEPLYRESRQSDFRRVFEVDSTIDAARIGANLEQGLLTLSLPKAEAAKPRRIEISGLN